MTLMKAVGQRPEVVETALGYARAGFPVFPCRPDNKRPYTANGFKDATTDAETIRAWWSEFQDPMIGLPTGNGLCIVDLDVDRETGEPIGAESAKALGWSEHLRAGLRARTPSGGWHIYFAGDLPCNSGKIAPKIDTRGTGGYVIAPGSINGVGEYVWHGKGLLDGPLPKLPRAIEEAARSARGRSVHTAAAADHGFRIDTGRADEDDVLDLLHRSANTLDRDDWVKMALALKGNFGESARPDWLAFSARYSGRQNAGEAERVWKTARPDGSLGLGTIVHLLGGWPETGSTKHSEGRNDRQPDGHRDESQKKEEAVVWPAPDKSLLENERRPAPPFPSEVFGAWADWIRQSAEVKNAPPDYVALALLSVAGSLLGNHRWPAPRSGWREPPVLWCAIVGDPSAGKSPGTDAVIDPLKEIGRRQAEQFKAKHEAWSEKEEVAKLAEAAWKERVKSAMKECEPAPDRPAAASIEAEPIRPRLFVSDTTTEKAGAILAEQPRGVLVHRDEAAGWLCSMDRYSGGGDRQFWLEAYGGRAYAVERQKTSVPIMVDHLSIGVLGGIQPDRLATLLRGDDDGLFARFAVVWPEPVPLVRPSVEMDEDTPRRAFERLLSLEPVIDEKGDWRPWFVPFDEGAQDLLHEFMVEARSWEQESAGLMKSHIGKFRGLAVRLAVVLQHLDWAISSEPTPPPRVTPNELGRACYFIAEYLRPMAVRTYGDAAAPPEERAARQLARIIADEKPQRINPRDVQRRKLTGLRTSKEISAAMGVLVEASWVVAEKVATKGRSRTDYLVNPAIWGGVS